MYSGMGIAHINGLSLACAIHTDGAATVAHSTARTKVPKMVDSDHFQQEWPRCREAGDSRWQALLTCVGESGDEVKK